MLVVSKLPRPRAMGALLEGREEYWTDVEALAPPAA